MTEIDSFFKFWNMENLKAFVHRKGKPEDSQWLLINAESEDSDKVDSSSIRVTAIRPRSQLIDSADRDSNEGRQRKTSSTRQTPESNETFERKTEQVKNDRLMPSLARRNAICDVIENHMYSGNRSLKKEREDLLRCITLANYSLL
jgi:hypothetical protein